MLECAFQAGLAFCLLSQIPPELWRGHRKLFLVDFVCVWLCVCLSVIISRFLIYAPYIIPGSRQTPHPNHRISLFVCPSRKDLTSWMRASWIHALWIHALWVHASRHGGHEHGGHGHAKCTWSS